MYRARIKPWNSYGWRPSKKYVHQQIETTGKVEVKEKNDDESMS